MLLLANASLFTSASARAADGPLADLPIQVEKLDNGLTVVMSPSRTIPTVAIAVYYDVGSRNEAKGRSGFAHLFEHMMFQGSANVGKGEHFSLVMNRGGTMNGTTSVDRTNYYETLPSNELELGLWLEADRMRSLVIDEDNFENQRQVVMEERRQSYETRPYMLSMLRINELAYGNYFPYAHSTIGHMEDLQNAPLSAVQAFFNTYYAPNNAVLSVAGDFEPEALMELVRKHFGNIPGSVVPEFAPDPLKPQSKEQVETMEDPLAKLPAFHIAYHIPPSRSADHYPLEMLADVLGDGDSSRLYQKLVKEEEMAQEISIATDDRRGPDLFSFWVVMAEGKKAEDARKIIYEELDKIAKEGVTEKELARVKAQARASFVYGLESNMARAMELATYQVYYGDAKLLREEPARYAAVTAEDIKRVAGKYFAAKNRTVLNVVPASSGKDADNRAAKSGAAKSGAAKSGAAKSGAAKPGAAKANKSEDPKKGNK